MKVIPYINVLNAKKSIKVYEELFGAKLLNTQPFNPEMGKQMGLPPEFDYPNSTMHAEFKIGDFLIYISDLTTQKTKENPPIELLLELDSTEQADAIWKKVKAKKMKVTMELEKTFWNAYYGRFVDDDGLGWQINVPLPIPAETPKNTPKEAKGPKKSTGVGKKSVKVKS